MSTEQSKTVLAQSSTQPQRRRDLDVIGILVVGGLVFLHTAQIFAPVVFYIKNAPSNFEEPSSRVGWVERM